MIRITNVIKGKLVPKENMIMISEFMPNELRTKQEEIQILPET